jgi:hypothetical protein
VMGKREVSPGGKKRCEPAMEFKKNNELSWDGVQSESWHLRGWGRKIAWVWEFENSLGNTGRLHLKKTRGRGKRRMRETLFMNLNLLEIMDCIMVWVFNIFKRLRIWSPACGTIGRNL